MTLGAKMTSDFDPPRDSTDPEESGIPALYTYFGQFIDHDITFDPMSSLIKHSDPDALTDFRTPAFDLDNVYGRGKDDQPYMYDDGPTFLLGDPIDGGADPNARDLPRNNANPRRALIGDPRNDENTIVSQLQGLFLRFHNRIIKDHPEIDPQADFSQIQKLVRFHYQYVVLNDFLPRIIHSNVLNDLKSADGRFDRHKLEFFHWKEKPFMPVEFSVAVYRLGHSMIRPGYRLNDNDFTLLPIFPVPSQGLPEGLTGFRALLPHFGIDWGRFIDIDLRAPGDENPANPDSKRRLQFAYRIDTSVVNPVSMLPKSVAPDPPPSLPQRNLIRSFELKLPSGQDVARAMHVTALRDDEIVIGKAVDTPGPGDVLGTIDSIPELSVFKGKCPLWTYILAEAARNRETVPIPVQGGGTATTPRLGPVGGRIVAEVFLGLMFGDGDSMLNLDPQWQPPSGPNYTLKDLVSYALGA
jgi:Animal haem peroxidase